MKILGIGTDIVDIERIARARFPERIAEFLFVEEELRNMHESRSIAQFIGSRLALKESVIKAFPGMLNYHDFQIIKNKEKLSVRFIDPSYDLYTVFVSVSHEFKYAVAYATLCSTSHR